jgi:hypothetical protein
MQKGRIDSGGCLPQLRLPHHNEMSRMRQRSFLLRSIMPTMRLPSVGRVKNAIAFKRTCGQPAAPGSRASHQLGTARIAAGNGFCDDESVRLLWPCESR